MAEKKTVRVASVKPDTKILDYKIKDIDAVFDHIDNNINAMVVQIHEAADAGCDVLAFPEGMMGIGSWGHGNKSLICSVYREVEKRVLEQFGRAASKCNMYVIGCMNVAEDDDSICNIAFLLGRDGKEIGRYRKVNMPLHELTKKRGESFPVFDTPDLGTVGMLICYDMIFPECARCLALAGADIVFHLTVEGAPKSETDGNMAMYRTRAMENWVYIVGSYCGGGGLIISASGKIIVSKPGTSELVTADIDPFSGRAGGDAMYKVKDMRSRIFRERSAAACAIMIDPNPPVLNKVPPTITIEEATQRSEKILTEGEVRFDEADKLLEDGKTDEATKAFKQLKIEFHDSWIDVAATERLEKIHAK